MLYLEDYIELIENLPMEMRDRFTEMRELDLQVQNEMDRLSERQKTFFRKAVDKSAPEKELFAEFKRLKSEYQGVLAYADEKVQIADQMHSVVEKHLKKLDHELHKFKMELEADNAGLTEMLEKRSLQLDKPYQTAVANKRKRDASYMNGDIGGGDYNDVKGSRSHFSQTLSLAVLNTARGDSLDMLSGGGSVKGSRPASPFLSNTPSPSFAMHDSRRRAAPRIDYDRLSRGLVVDETAQAAGDVGNASSRGVPATFRGVARKKEQQRYQPLPDPSPDLNDWSNDGLDDGAQDGEETDQDELRYCSCNQVSYGDMVACDYPACQYEWFHYACVGITVPPKGKWYCPDCTLILKQKRSTRK